MALVRAKLLKDKAGLLKTLEGSRLGLKRGTVGLVDYQTSWKCAYDFLHDLIAEELASSKIAIEHIGSTAIPGVWAKPIVDILLVFERGQDFSSETRALEKIGFLAKGEYGMFERHFFTFYNMDETFDYVHIHAFPKGNKHIEQLLSFRNKLKDSPKLVQEYTALKKDLLTKGVSRKDYPAAKNTFVKNILASL